MERIRNRTIKEYGLGGNGATVVLLPKNAQVLGVKMVGSALNIVAFVDEVAETEPRIFHCLHGWGSLKGNKIIYIGSVDQPSPPYQAVPPGQYQPVFYPLTFHVFEEYE